MEKGRIGVNQIWVTEVRLATALGDLEQTWDGLLQGRSGIREVTHLDTSGLGSNLGAPIANLGPRRNGTTRLHPILDQILTESLTVSEEPFLITATIKGGIDNLEALYQGREADTDDILPSRLPALVSKKLGIKLAPGGFNVNAACASGTTAIARAASMIRSGICDCSIVCCAESLSLFSYAGFASLRILSPQPCRPFDRDRDGVTQGEGAVVLVLMNAQKAKEMGRPCYGVVMGWGMTNDAEQIITPAHDARGLIDAIKNALTCAGLDPREIGAIGAHGTGTIYNDAAELLAIHEVFPTDDVPVYSVKGSLGHTLGAAGGIEAAIALKALSVGIVPPTAGLKNREKDSQVRVVSEATSFDGRYMLTMNSGFGGANCALVIGAGAA
jgi:3-oxoacyl-[acyl-carrier-protein] synthase II